MANYPSLQYSMNAVRRAGEILRTSIIVDETFGRAEREAAVEAFAIANSYRDDHVYPMRSIRLSLQYKMRRCGATGLTAARPKRMSSIRRKLASSSIKLDQINDLGGCRFIMDDNAGVQAIIRAVRDEFPHPIRQEYPYIEKPKADGYRSHHVVLTYVGRGKGEPYDGRRIELQVRTRLQHAWATAVEAIGLFRDEDLKHGAGNEDWLRLFTLASAEFSHSEGCPVHPDMPGRDERIRELKDLNGRLRATSTLEDLKNLTNFAENYYYAPGAFYLIRYGKDHTVRVQSYTSPIYGTQSLRDVEREIELGENDSKAVLVQVDKIDKLIETYPSYFGDVGLFVRNLKLVCEGKEAIEYSMVPQERVAVQREPRGDPASLRSRYTRWFDSWSGKRN